MIYSLPLKFGYRAANEDKKSELRRPKLHVLVKQVTKVVQISKYEKENIF